MDQEKEFAPRLDMIETEWTMLRNAHCGTIGTGVNARNSLVLRYAPAIRSYVGAVTKSDVDADELSQEVIVRLLKGDFGGADPNRGRFRDLLKVAVKNMTRNHWAKENKRKGVDCDLELTQDDSQAAPDPEWEASWQNNVLDIAWSRLEAYQDTNENSVLSSALKLKTNHPDSDSSTLARLLSKEQGREISAANYRQQLRRARVKFAEYIVEEIANGIDSTDPARIQEELIDVGVFEQIKSVLPDSWQKAK